MRKRTVLALRTLPVYTAGEEIVNSVSHGAGCLFGLAALILCLLRTDSTTERIGCTIYGISLICLYGVSCIYHALRPGTGKKVMQIVDHCTIYFLIVGTYTAILLNSMIPAYPVIGWGLLSAEWLLAILATVFTAIDLRNYRVFSMICYIGMGWGIIFFMSEIYQVLTPTGFAYLLSGGIVYTLGAILYGIGSKLPWFHSVFHIFVLGGSVLQFLSIFLYTLI